MRIDLSFLPALGAAFLLVFARIGTMVMLLPGLGEMSVPARSRLAMALGLAFVLLPLHRNSYQLVLRSFGAVLTMLGEALFIGLGETVDQHRLGHCPAYGHARVERTERVLKHHLHAPAQRTQLLVVKHGEFDAVEPHLARRRPHQLQDGPAEGYAQGERYREVVGRIRQANAREPDRTSREREAREQQDECH